eukprot:c29136_g1_i2 orf=571-1098(-)
MGDLPKVIGNYIVMELIGAGSFAIVWKAVHRQDGIEVAIKEFDRRKLNKQLQQRMFVEISILKQIKHPNIVRLNEIIEAGNGIFLVLEYCAGGDLARYIQRHGRVTEATARNFMQQLGAGLKALHVSNPIHRDLKPELLRNIKKSSAVHFPGALATELHPDCMDLCQKLLCLDPE